jgi:hypothetical protein
MQDGEASGKPWRPSLRADDLERFAEKARGLNTKFLDRDGKPMSPDEWIEARTDPGYLLVAVDCNENLEVATTWIGVHLDSDPSWERVIFGTQIVYLHPEDMEVLAGPLPDPTQFMPADSEESFNLLRLIEPVFGELIGRYAWGKLSDAEAGHKLVADGFRARFQTERTSKGEESPPASSAWP